MLRGSVAALALALAGGGLAAEAAPVMAVEGTEFVLQLDDGRSLRSADLAGAVLEVSDAAGQPLRLRIDAVFPHPDNPGATLHDFRVEAAPGDWQPYCTPDANGIAAGFPMAGAWTADGTFIPDRARSFVTCTSGSQAKCLLMGYDPWGTACDGAPLLPLYQACQHMVRAAYGGTAAHTTEGTTIDIYDNHGIQTFETLADPSFAFEAGWTPEGAVCLDHARHPEKIGRDAILTLYPQIARGACDEAAARTAGAILFNRSRPIPTDGF